MSAGLQAARDAPAAREKLANVLLSLDDGEGPSVGCRSRPGSNVIMVGVRRPGRPIMEES
jgi:hypothetical protein